MRELDRLFGGRVLAMSSDQRGLRGPYASGFCPMADSQVKGVLAHAEEPGRAGGQD